MNDHNDGIQHTPITEEFDFGLIDEYGRLRILVGNQFMPVTCLRIFETGRSSDHTCRYACSHFSGLKNITISVDCKDQSRIVVKLLCSGRTMYFKRFINLLDRHKLETQLDFEKMSDEDIVKELGLLDKEMLEE